MEFGRLFLVALVGAACAESAIPVFLPPTSASSWILAAEQYDRVDSESLQLTALSEETGAARFLGNRDALRVYALGYDVALSRLGLGAGSIAPALSCERSCALAKPARRFVMEYSRGHEPHWSANDTVGDVVLDALVPDRGPRCEERCLRFTSTSADLASVQGATFLRPERLSSSDPSVAESAVLGLADGSIYRVRGPGDIERICDPGALVYSAGEYDEGTGRLWVAATNGALGWIDLPANRAGPCAFTQTATSPAESLIRWLAVLPGRQPPETVALSSNGVLARFAPNFTRLGSVTLAPNEGNARAGFVAARGAWIYAAAAGPEVVMVSEGRLARQGGFDLGTRGAEVRSAVSHLDDVYVAVTTYNLFVRRAHSGVFAPLDEGPGRVGSPWEDPDSLVFLGEHILAPLTGGFIGEWSPHTGYCPLQAGFTFDGHNIKTMLNIQGTLFVADASVEVRPRTVRWLVPEAPDACPMR